MPERTSQRPPGGPKRSVGGGLHHRPHRSWWPVERAVDLIKGEALGFGTEYPEADQADHTPRSKIKKSRPQHGEVRRSRLDHIARPHDQRQAEGADELAEIASTIAQTHPAGAQSRRPYLRHVRTNHRVVGAGEKA